MAERGDVVVGQTMASLPLVNQNHSNRPCSSATNSSSNTPRGGGSNLPKLDTPTDEFPAGMRVLVVDDDPICLMVLERMLHRCSYRGTLSFFLARRTLTGSTLACCRV